MLRGVLTILLCGLSACILPKVNFSGRSISCVTSADCPQGFECDARAKLCRNLGEQDSDEDGVVDAFDRCPDGDDKLDLDGDGVADACDKCARGDDALDADGDEVPDACDRCSAGVDGIDADRDTVPDACDVCEGGNDFFDADIDNVPDGCDSCPGVVDQEGDSDGDAVPDVCDRCAGSDDKLDTDKDGVPDGCDVCAAGNDALDFDEDGVPNACDVCASADDMSDADGDQIPDACDICPATNNNTLEENDEPDAFVTGATFFDANCDGIDGKIADVVFVSPAGFDNETRGTRDRPLRSLAYATTRAAALNKAHVLVAAGVYEGNLVLASGVSLHGGYSLDFSTRRLDQLASLESFSSPAVSAAGLTGGVVMEGIDVRCADQSTAGMSSIALLTTNVNASLTFRGLTLRAGRGADGAVGAAGLPGPDGNAGTAGQSVAGGFAGPGGAPRSCPDGGSAGAGGSGASSVVVRQAGNEGYDVLERRVAQGGEVGGCTVLDNQGKSPSSDGDPGDNSSAVAASTQRKGSIVSGRWQALSGASDAQSGVPGSGGGGGCYIAQGGNNGGGGGGSGGCGGGAGGAGGGAGGSIVALMSASPGVVFEQVSFVAADGGKGGAGGAGGSAGAAGEGGEGSGGNFNGGGNGSAGGAGGGAQGGAGGVSCGVMCIADNTACAAVNDAAITLGVAGAGGAGGAGDASIGIAPSGASNVAQKKIDYGTWTP